MNKKQIWQTGEIATTLTLISLLVILSGTIIGANQSVQKNLTTWFSRADTTTNLTCNDGTCTISKFQITNTRSRGTDQFIFKGNLCFSGIQIPAEARFFVEITGKDTDGRTVTVGKAANVITVPSES